MQVTLFLVELSLFIMFGYVLANWFKNVFQVTRWELYLIKYAAPVFSIAHLAGAYYSPLENHWLYAVGLLLLILSGIIFISAFSVFKNNPPAVAFSNEILTPLKTKGIYRYIRHPFYTSYWLTWIGGTIATANWWLSISAIVLGYVYYKASKEEEQQWLNSSAKEQYRKYMLRTGMFLPSLYSLYLFFISCLIKNTDIPVQLATTEKDMADIYRFRYKIYIEETGKTHLPADHINKLMKDENDVLSAIYIARDKTGSVVGTARAHRGTDGSFLKTDIELFELERFAIYFGHNCLAIVNRLAIEKKYRKTTLATSFFIATYQGGIQQGTKLCFILSEQSLLPMYQHFGFRIYSEPILLNGKKRYRMVLCLNDKQFLSACGSPFAKLVPLDTDDKGETAKEIENLGFKLS